MPTEPMILAVDDDENDLLLLNHAFKRADASCRLVTLTDGRDAIDYLNGDHPFSDRQKHPLPSLLLLDIKMPAVSGFEVLSWVRAQAVFSQLPVIMLSSSGAEVDKVQARTLGANRFVVKPNTLTELTQLARQLAAGVDATTLAEPGPACPVCDRSAA